MFPAVPGLIGLEKLADRDGTEIWRGRWRDGAPVAVKRLVSSRPDRVIRFEAEGRLLQAVGGRSGLISCLAVLDDPPALVLEYLGSGSLRDRIEAERAGLPIAEGCRIVARVAVAVAWLHRNDIIHRDVKPSNVLLGEGGEVRLIDLGVAASGRPPRGMPDGFVEEEVGTLGFAAPELLRSPATATVAVDVYGLGSTLYETLTGHLPYDFGPTESDEFFRARIQDGERAIPVRDRADVPPELAAVIDASLAVDPRARPESAVAFAEQIGWFA